MPKDWERGITVVLLIRGADRLPTQGGLRGETAVAEWAVAYRRDLHECGG